MGYEKTYWQVGDVVTADKLNHAEDGIEGNAIDIRALQQGYEVVQEMVGAPLVASTAAGMTDHSKIYVYTGSESGYVNGDWYYWDGTAWADGGTYNAVAVSTDKTLSILDQAADAQATGKMIVVNGTSAESTRVNITTTTEDVELAEMRDVDELKNALVPTNNVDVLAFATPQSRTHNNVTFTFNSDGSCVVRGTASSLATGVYYTSSNAMPDWIVPGETYSIKYSGTNVIFGIYTYHNGTMDTPALVGTYTDTTVTIPSDATGLQIRLAVSSGVTVNETVHPRIIHYVDDITDIKNILNYTVKTNGNYSTIIQDGTDFDSITTAGEYRVANTTSAGTMSNIPINRPGRLIVAGLTGASRNIQLYASTNNHYYIRYYTTDSIWSGWEEIPHGFNQDSLTIYKRPLTNGENLNDFLGNGRYSISISVRDTLLNKPEAWTSGTGTFITLYGGAGGENVTAQIIIVNRPQVYCVYYRLMNNVSGTPITNYGWRLIASELFDTTGTSEEGGMTQKAITDTFNSLETAVSIYRGNLSSGDNLDNFDNDGRYSIPTSIRPSILNTPTEWTAGTGTLFVFKGSCGGPNVSTQILFTQPQDGYVIFERLMNNTTHAPISGHGWRIIASDLKTTTGSSESFSMTQKAITEAIENKPFLTWKNKTIVIFGDSRTWYDGKTYISTTKSEWRGNTCIGYQETVKAVCGTTNIINEGVSGNTTVQIATRIKAYDFSNADCLIIAGGVNDFVKSSQVTIGTIDSIGATFDTSTAYGALQDAIEYVLYNYPDMKIYIIVPAIAWVGGNIFPYSTAEVRKNIAELYNIPYVDLYKKAGINVINRNYFYVDDPTLTNDWYLHFNDYGNAWLGSIIGKFINSI